MSSVVLTLGDFQFAPFEIPEQIGFGGEQSLTVHKLVGGARVVDAMGDDPRAPAWSGLFVGSNALPRAQYVDGLRKAGKPLLLTWSELRYTVVIRSFEADFRLINRIPYRITCEVVSDDTTPVTEIADPSPEQLVADDLDDAGSLVDAIGDGALSSLMATLTSAVSVVGDLSAASLSNLNSILMPLGAVRARVGELQDVADAALSGAASVGGVVPGVTAAAQVSALTSQIAAATMQPNLATLDGTLGRIAANISAINSGTASIVVAGGDLFSIASEHYGDPMGWTAIAAANGLSDPELASISTLTIPAFSNDTGGVLNA